MSVERRPAFYALETGGWRDYVTLLHPPYTAWHLSYVVIGAALAPELPVNRLVWGLIAFALALGVGAHALDELNGHPLRTAIPDKVLIALAVVSTGAAAAIGVGGAFAWTFWLLPFVAFGAFLVPAYSLELFGGRFHSDLWFALGWGAFPVLTAEQIHATGTRHGAGTGQVLLRPVEPGRGRRSTSSPTCSSGTPSSALVNEMLRMLGGT